MSISDSLMQTAVSLRDVSIKDHTPTIIATPAKTRVRVLILPPDHNPQHVVIFMLMMIAFAVGGGTESARTIAVMSILTTIFSPEGIFFSLVTKFVAVAFEPVQLSWVDKQKKVRVSNHDNRILNIKSNAEDHEDLVKLVIATSERTLPEIIPGVSAVDEIPSAARPFLFRQIIFCFAKALSARGTAADWARNQIRKLADGVRSDAPVEFILSDSALKTMVLLFSQSLMARGAVVEVIIACMTATHRDDVMTAIGQQGMYLRNIGMTPLMIVKKYAIEAGYPEIQGERGLGAELKAYILARQTLINGGLRAAFMFFIQAPETALLHPNNFPKLFSFARGAGMVEEPSLQDYVTSFKVNDAWIQLGEAAAKNRVTEIEQRVTNDKDH
ncbi:nucleoprotein [Wenling tonguesole paramyxovirus]|uniref:Nucleoprotein n=1 Tax=Wenling tonguesole paramyxovirus TaxID=2116454 RepID=A0A2P1GN23_9MONO|nr:nucleoprotein [Wenling tonguesole paramyxovirus]AVM87370.1 nucleoprotein [Wenling tonguesole paramyxovirus]